MFLTSAFVVAVALPPIVGGDELTMFELVFVVVDAVKREDPIEFRFEASAAAWLRARALNGMESVKMIHRILILTKFELLRYSFIFM